MQPKQKPMHRLLLVLDVPERNTKTLHVLLEAKNAAGHVQSVKLRSESLGSEREGRKKE